MSNRQKRISAKEYQRTYGGKGGGRSKKIIHTRSHVVQGRRKIGEQTIFFRSKAEANYARYLQWLLERGDILQWQFEPKKFIFKQRTGTNHYTPDFEVWYSATTYEWHEVKGWLDNKSKVKLKRFAEQYPEEPKPLIITSKNVATIGEQLGALIPGWE